METGFSGLSYTQIRMISTTLKTKATSMKEILDQVKTEFNKIGGDDTWSGTSAGAAKEQFDALSAKFPEFYEAITSCSEYLEKVVQSYEAVDAKIQGI